MIDKDKSLLVILNSTTSKSGISTPSAVNVSQSNVPIPFGHANSHAVPGSPDPTVSYLQIKYSLTQINRNTETYILTFITDWKLEI